MVKPITMSAQLPIYPFLFVIPVGGALFLFAFVLQLVQQVRLLVGTRSEIIEQ